MHINDPDFVRRRIVGRSNEYSPKRRWDENAFGSERRLLIDHVEKTLKEHENDGDILEKFKKQAEQMKEKKRREKFPYLFNNSNIQENLLSSETTKNPPTKYVNEFEQPLKQQLQQMQQFKQKQSLVRPFQTPTLPTKLPPISHYPPFAIPASNPFQLQSCLQYERTIARKDLQLYKKQQKIKWQKKQINRLYRQLKEKQREDQLQKYVKSQEQIKKMNQMLMEMKEELTSRKSLLTGEKDVLIEANQQADRRRNKSELYLNSYNSMALVNEHIRPAKDKEYESREIGSAFRQAASPIKQNITGRKSLIPRLEQNLSNMKNPQIEYSGQIKKNRSSVFEKVPMYNSPLLKSNSSLNAHLDQLKNYNQRLEYFHDYNKSKLSQVH